MQKTGVILIKEFFSTPERPVTMDELKKCTSEDRRELADAIAKQQNLSRVDGAAGPVYQ